MKFSFIPRELNAFAEIRKFLIIEKFSKFAEDNTFLKKLYRPSKRYL